MARDVRSEAAAASEPDYYLVPAIAWIRKCGGVGPAADRVLALEAVSRSATDCAAGLSDAELLRKMGAPVGVLGILSAALYHKRRGLATPLEEGER